MNDVRLNRLSDIAANLGYVSIASVVVPLFLDRGDPKLVVSGLAMSLVLWGLSLWLARKQ